MEVLGLDRSHCTIGETEHPYTLEFNNKDVRITTHYDEGNLASSMYSVIPAAPGKAPAFSGKWPG